MAQLPKTPKGTPDARIGAAIGEKLADEVVHQMLERFAGLPPDPLAIREFGDAFDDLVQKLGPAVDGTGVRDALQRLNHAHGSDAAAARDEAWHASWSTLRGLMTGETFSAKNARRLNVLAVQKGRD